MIIKTFESSFEVGPIAPAFPAWLHQLGDCKQSYTSYALARLGTTLIRNSWV
jgi:hypothetical protein